jgi:hypothetical protein
MMTAYYATGIAKDLSTVHRGQNNRMKVTDDEKGEGIHTYFPLNIY